MKNFPHTHAALAEYDADKPRIEAMFEAIDTNEDVYAWEAAEKAAADKVRRAFHEDTSEYNSLGSCLSTSIEFLRRVAACNVEEDL